MGLHLRYPSGCTYDHTYKREIRSLISHGRKVHKIWCIIVFRCSLSHLKAKIVPVYMDVNSHWIHIRIGTSVPFRKFDTLHLQQLHVIFFQQLEILHREHGTKMNTYYAYKNNDTTYSHKLLKRQMNNQLLIRITLHTQS